MGRGDAPVDFEIERVAPDLLLDIDPLSRAKHFARLAAGELENGNIEQALWQLRAPELSEVLATDPLEEFAVEILDHYCTVANALSERPNAKMPSRQLQIARAVGLDPDICKLLVREAPQRAQLACRDELRYQLLAEDDDHRLYRTIVNSGLADACDRAFAQAVAAHLAGSGLFDRLFPVPTLTEQGIKRLTAIAADIMRKAYGSGTSWDRPEIEELGATLALAILLADGDEDSYIGPRFTCLILRQYSAPHHFAQLASRAQYLSATCQKVVASLTP